MLFLCPAEVIKDLEENHLVIFSLTKKNLKMCHVVHLKSTAATFLFFTAPKE
jgi:hypothetical protein